MGKRGQGRRRRLGKERTAGSPRLSQGGSRPPSPTTALPPRAWDQALDPRGQVSLPLWIIPPGADITQLRDVRAGDYSTEDGESPKLRGK